jgi:hypothetical protein
MYLWPNKMLGQHVDIRYDEYQQRQQPISCHCMFSPTRPMVNFNCPREVSFLSILPSYVKGRDSAVGIATPYGPAGPAIEPGGGEIFRPRPDRPWGPPSLLFNGYGVFPGVRGRGVALSTHSHLALRLKKEQSYKSVPPLGLRGLFESELYLYLYLIILASRRIVWEMMFEDVNVMWHAGADPGGWGLKFVQILGLSLRKRIQN